MRGFLFLSKSITADRVGVERRERLNAPGPQMNDSRILRAKKLHTQDSNKSLRRSLKQALTALK